MSLGLLRRLIPRRWLRIGLALAVAAAIGFGLHAAMVAADWSERRGPDLEGWMTLAMIARTHGVERDALAAALGLEPGDGTGLSLDAIAQRGGCTSGEVAAALDAALRAASADPAGAAE